MNAPVDAGGTPVHSTAIVHPDARLHPSVSVGPSTVIGPGVEIAAGVRIGAHVVIDRDTRIGEECRIFHGASVGGDPQDLKYAGESTRLEIGERTTIREFCTISRGTSATGVTRVGSDSLLMAYTHVGHDSVIGDHVVLANLAQLGGHVEIGDWAIFGASVGVHQFTRIGAHAFVGGMSRVTQDVPPYLLVVGSPCTARGINVVGLQRRGLPKSSIDGLRAAFRDLFKSRDHNLGQALDVLDSQDDLVPEVISLIAFIRESERGITT
jgi:UDP-N-acetylglucosamine acyltransferase